MFMHLEMGVPSTESRMLVEKTRRDEILRKERLKILEAKRRRRRSTATAIAEAEAAEAAKRAAEMKRALRKKRREEERKAQHARNFNQASMPSSPVRQLRIIKGKPRLINDACSPQNP